ncbi:hypothetical protein [Phenylobacterium sp.]|uniref:hypothetical protein n=1 Tax=Phenylobacterium sp. TaxID=1871053 RepID=UPI003BAA3C47
MTAFVPPALTGLWRREVITTPKGYRDETTRVLWLQTRSWYADIRVKADRPARPGATGFADYSDAELIQLAAVEGFAGELTATGDICLWRRDLDYQPPSGSPDEATFAVSGDVMIEDGIHSDYQEIWRREPGSASPLVAYRRTGGAGLLVIAGGYFTEILDRATPLPKGESLAAIVSEALGAGRREAALAALSLRICHGRVAGAGRRVTLSTYPWLEGQDIGGVDPAEWTLIDCDVPAPAPS